MESATSHSLPPTAPHARTRSRVPLAPPRGPTKSHARSRTRRARGPLGARMRRQVHLGQLGSVNMRVDLRGRDIRMPQNLLKHAQIRAAG